MAISTSAATAAQQPDVKVIPAKRPKFMADINAAQVVRRRTAAYARVSSDTDEQLNSYGAQVDFYTNYIQSRSDWQFVGVYADEGISGLNTKKRKGFNEMVEDALGGKIDLIITKSVSRFARNTLDSIKTIRDLKDKGVDVFFEKENLWASDGKSELMLTIMASLAQEEARSLSQNVTWGKQKAMAAGKFALPWSSVLGYEKGEDGLPQVVSEQAQIVRYIYSQYMEGKTCRAIAKILTERGVPTPRGNSKKWSYQTVQNVLTNELYRGSKKLQKTLTVNYLTKKKKVNEGELPSYYIERSHECIIPPDEWDAVQDEMARRQERGRPTSCQSPLATKIQCGDCGGWFGSKIWNSTSDKYRTTIWRCNERYKKNGETAEDGKPRKCHTPHLREDDIKTAFVTAVNKLLSNRDDIIADCRAAQNVVADTAEIDAEIEKAQTELAEILDTMERAIYENAHTAIDQDKWNKENVIHQQRHVAVTERLAKLERQKTDKTQRSKTIGLFIRDIEKQAAIVTDWDEGLWAAVIDRMVVSADGALTFRFKNGTKIKV